MKLTIVVCGSNLHISIISPAWAPWVLDNEVLLITVLTVSNSKYSVVKVGTTRRIIKNSTIVELECKGISFNGNRNRALIDSGLQLRNRVSENIVVSFNSDLALTLRSLASAVKTFVRIGALCFQRCTLGVGECSIHFTAPATSVALSSWAINKLLLWQG